MPAPLLMPIRAHGAWRLDGAAHARLTCEDGRAWITIDGERRDIVLERGESFLVDSRRPLLIAPLRGGDTLRMRLDYAPADPPHPALEAGVPLRRPARAARAALGAA